ncbi:MAG: FtsX-like permease family protein [Patescibacteria group bacterium]
MANDYGDVKIIHRLGYLDLIKLSVRVFRTKLMRTLLTIFGMSVGIGTVLFLVSLGYGLQYILIGKLVTSEDSLITLEALYPPEVSRNLTSADIEDIAKLPEVAEISPVAEFPGELKTGNLPGIVFMVIVKDNYFRLAGVKPDIGVPFSEGKPGIVVSNSTMQLFNASSTPASLNKEFSLKVTYQSDNGEETSVSPEVSLAKPVPLLGILTEDSQTPTVFVPSSLVPTPPPFFRRALVKATNIDMVEALRDKLITKGYFISAKIDLVNQARGVLRAITITLGVFGITALFVAAIGMFNTMIVGFLERIYEVGIMKSLGATDRDIRTLVLMESSMIGFLGGVGGITLGLVLGQTGNFIISTLSQRLGGEAIQLFITPLWFMGLIIGISILIGLVAGFWPARKAATLSPKEAFVRK